MAKAVLVVDDSQDFLELAEMVLTAQGYAVVPCLTASDAYPKARQFRPAVALIDLLMPDRSGLQVIEQLKADPMTAGIRVIVCTAAVPQVARESAQLKGWGCDVLVKPFELRELLIRLENATKQKNAG